MVQNKNWHKARVKYVWILVLDRNRLGDEKDSWKWQEWHKLEAYIHV